MGNYLEIPEAKLVLSRVLAIYDSSDAHLGLIIDEAEGMVDAAIASRYTTPVTDTAAINYLRGLTASIVRYKTWTQFADQDDIPEGVKLDYQATMKNLDNLAKRITSLPNVADKTTGRASYIKIHQSTSTIAGY